MAEIVSPRAQKTEGMLVLPSSLEDAARARPGMLKIGLLATCGSIFALFAAVVIAYYWRATTPPLWAPVALPSTLWISTAVIAVSSATFEIGRRQYGVGAYRMARGWFIATACLGCAFLVAQAQAWRELVHTGAFLVQNPHSSFFYVFTGLHAAHLLGGLIAVGMVLVRSNARRELIDVTVYYWHFLGVLWAGLYASLRLI